MHRTLACFITSLLLAAAACGDLNRQPTSPNAQERKDALDALEPVLATLPVGDFAANTNRLVQAIKALPQFADAGSAPDGTVWGMFKGGILLFVVPLPPAQGDPAQVPVAAAPPLEAGTRPMALTSSSAGGTVPKSPRFRLFNGLGSYFSDSDPRTEIQAMLMANGYTGTSDEATLSSLRTVK